MLAVWTVFFLAIFLMGIPEIALSAIYVWVLVAIMINGTFALLPMNALLFQPIYGDGLDAALLPGPAGQWRGRSDLLGGCQPDLV